MNISILVYPIWSKNELHLGERKYLQSTVNDSLERDTESYMKLTSTRSSRASLISTIFLHSSLEQESYQVTKKFTFLFCDQLVCSWCPLFPLDYVCVWLPGENTQTCFLFMKSDFNMFGFNQHLAAAVRFHLQNQFLDKLLSITS